MRVLGMLWVVLCGCGPQSADSVYLSAQTLLRHGELKQGLSLADSGLRAEASWRFRLIKAEILLASGEAQNTLDLLKAAPSPPSNEVRARVAMYQGHARYLLTDLAGA